jgi:poly-beta-1,6-N-acetyl-D-glucosamine synthase
MKAQAMKYVLITPARNEEKFVGHTIRSVAAQTLRPVKWIIVSDGSTDRTDEIVKACAAEHNWIELLRMPERTERHFAAKARAVNAAYDLLRPTAFDVVGNLDADVTFEADYFEFLMQQFAASPKLGVAGTPYVEDGAKAAAHNLSGSIGNFNHVSGPCQLFRRACFEAVGGYVPIKLGAVDWVAVTTARMQGWETKSFLGKTYFHHRKMGTAECGDLSARFRYGRKAYYVGGHPLWEILRGFFQMREKPRVSGGLWFLAGFIGAALLRMERPVSAELMAFHRREQMARLRGLWQRRAEKKQPSPDVAAPGTTPISVNGKMTAVRSVTIDNRCIVTTGKLLKKAIIESESFEEGEMVKDPARFVTELKRSHLPADIFSFAQDVTESKPKFPELHMEHDNVAAIPLTSYEDWLKNLSQDSRRNVRLAEKRGVKVRVVPFDDAFVQGIKGIYDETPIRQGRRFWHYGKEFSAVKRENGTYVERSSFIGAYLGEEMIGFLKVVYVNQTGSIMQILSKNGHFDKRPANAMIAKAVEAACQKGMTHLIYCRYTYGNKSDSSIKEFKRRTGFEQMNFPRYYIPLTLKGKMALKLGLHGGLSNVLPSSWLNFLLDIRSKFYEKRYGGQQSGKNEPKLEPAGFPAPAAKSGNIS